MTGKSKPTAEDVPAIARILDIGAGDPEAPANAIPNIIAHLVENLERARTRDITKQLKILGTPRYMAPERILKPADVDARSDIYAVGAVGYFLLTGKPIFEGDNSLEITNQIMHAPAPRAAASGVAGIPEALDVLIAACLEKDRARRPQSADAVIDALDGLSSRLAWTQVDAERWWASYRESRSVASPTVALPA